MLIDRRGWSAIALLFVLALSAADDPRPAETSRRQSQQAALQPFAILVGPWKGTGQPVRNNAKGAWTESGSWAWQLTPDSAALKLTVEKGKFLRAAVMRPGAKSDEFALEATLADGSIRAFTGKASKELKGRVVFDAVDPKGDGPRRLTLTALHEARFLLLFESRPADADRFTRLAEVGYTKQGVAFAAGDAYPVCIVTGGRGTAQVTYAGKSYWVCCSGCRDLFNDDPKAILAEAEAKKRPGGK